MKEFRRVLLICMIIIIIIATMQLVFYWNNYSISDDFYYEANIISLDNFYNSEKNTFSGDTISKTRFLYNVISKKDEVLVIENIFDVRKVTGERIFSVRREYGIDQKTGKHVRGYGDKERSGYLFAPKNLKSKQSFAYWHVNYDAPAEMQFQGEEELLGLKVFRYEADYNADQTANLAHLPGVPEKRGVILDISLQTWIEPITGRLIKYEDNTVAYYYDIKTKERIEPWNKFHNKYTEASIKKQVNIASEEKLKILVFNKLIPMLIIIMATLTIKLCTVAKNKHRK